jgi:hypothetical protein
MKKSLLLAALLLSSAAQAETYVCSEPLSDGSSYLHTFVRQGFSQQITGPEFRSKSYPHEILVETDAMLTLAEINPDGTKITIFMINKITNQFVNDAITFDGELRKVQGSCVKI